MSGGYLWLTGRRWPGPRRVQSEVVMFTAVFVLLTLLVQAPLLPHVLHWTG